MIKYVLSRVLVHELSHQSAWKSQLRVNKCDDNGGGGGCGKSGGRGTHLEERNNMHMDSRHTDSNGRTDAGSIRRDNNSGTLDKRCSRPEIQN